jgi:hypothetical protein
VEHSTDAQESIGHYEINYVKAIFKLTWHAGLKEFAKMLGFKSPKALSFRKSASNRHKSWAMIQIFFKSFSKELVLPFNKLEHHHSGMIFFFCQALITTYQHTYFSIKWFLARLFF